MKNVAPITMVSILALAVPAVPVAAQEPPPEPKIWAVAFGAGLAQASGNTDTFSFNASYDITYDPQTRNIVKSDALFLRGSTDGDLSSDRFGFNLRDQYKITKRVYVFGQNQYLHDSFKDIDYLDAPTGGLGYRLLDRPQTTLDADAGLGAVWEKNPGFDLKTSGALTASEKFAQKLTTIAALTQSIQALWKTKDFDDALYVFGVGIAASTSPRTQLKFEVLDTYKSKPPSAAVKKNDVATLIAFVYKT